MNKQQQTNKELNKMTNKTTIDLTPDRKSLIRTLAFIVENGKQSERNWAMKQMERIDNEQKREAK